MSKQKLYADLQKLPQFKFTSKKWGLGECLYFYVRWRKREDVLGEFVVEFAEKKTFDKWGNSTNFIMHLQYKRNTYREDIVNAYRWMRRVCRSELFDFNRYVDSIATPWNKCIRN